MAITQLITRRQYLRGATGLGAAALAGCGAADQGAAPVSAGPVTVKFMSSQNPTTTSALATLKVFEEFNRTNQLGITVDLSEAGVGTTPDKMKTLSAGSTPPDMYMAAFSNVPEFFVTGITVDVDAELKGDRDWAKQRADIFPNMLDSQVWNGKLASVPISTNNQGIIYNVGLLQRDGVALPKQNWTWNDFRAMAERYIRPDVVAFSVNWDDWDHFLGTTGSRPVSKDGRKVTIDTPEMLATMEFMVGLYRSGIAQMTPDFKSVAEQYRNAKNDTVFELQGAYRFPVFKQANAPQWAAIHIPVRPQGGQLFGFAGGHSITISNVAPEKKRAGALAAKFVNAPKQQVQVAIAGSTIPISKAAMSDKALEDYVKTDAPYKALIDLAPHNWRWPALPSQTKINAAIDTHVGAILRREVSISAGLANAQREGQLALEEDLKLVK